MLLKLIYFSLIAGITVLLGGLLANLFNHHVKESPVKYEITHTLMSFGAGIILAAVALVLIPYGMKQLSLWPMVLFFALGAISFMFLDQFLERKDGNTATLLAMMMDFIPEAIAMGAVFSKNPSMAILLAIIIGLQNLPESFNAFRDLVLSGMAIKKTLIVFFGLSLFGVPAALLGYLLLSNSTIITAQLMTFASGGILYLLIQDIIPASKLEKNYLTALGAIIGFLVGIVSSMVI
ncbi:MAG: hypothetical protein PHI32_01560 [Dysgonamonadaceae bacterium]|nr:hypothetical protein [Dysgonamonadaceae bacterium]MDD4729349.1 hypothetical protein [Dysgonamonadaceae bacterium]